MSDIVERYFEDEPPEQITPEMIEALGGEDQIRSFLAALFVVQYELAQQDRSLS